MRQYGTAVLGGLPLALTDDATRLAYATDASVYRIEPRGVVVARTLDDAHATLAWCRAEGVALTARGAGTSLAGQAIGGGVVLDLSRCDRILSLDPETRLARVEPGVVQATLDAVAAEHGLCFGPDTATATRATLGGMIANDSAGMRSAVYGRTSHRVRRLRVLLADGTERWVGETDAADIDGPFAAARAIHDANRDEIERRWPRLLRCVDGYNLPALAGTRPNLARFLCGSEGTLALVLEAEVELDVRPQLRAWTIVRLASLDAIGDATLAMLPSGPSAVEIVDSGAIVGNRQAAEISGGADAVLLVEHQGTPDEVAAGRAAIGDVAGSLGIVPVDGAEATAAIIEFRRTMLGTVQRSVRGGRTPTTVVEDGAVPVERLGEYLGALRAIFRDEGTASVIYGHASVGCVHARPLLDLADPEDVRRFRRLAERVADLIIASGGALSGEHGDGLLRSELLPRLFGQTLVGAFAAVKVAFDPGGILNPGKVVDPPPLDASLRLAAADTSDPLGAAAAGCIGIGACIEHHAGTMCPPYRVTGDERQSTRGRANLLREMVAGTIAADAPELAESLALCVSCKACKRECPAGVDVAWMKAEYLERRWAAAGGVPARERAFAEAPVMLARLSRAPRLANAAARSPLGALQARRLGIHPSRSLPNVARHSLRQLVEGRYRARRLDVGLFVDTFTNLIDPEIGIAALDYLDAVGASVALAPNVCCGRTYIAAGMLDEARQLARENVRRLLPLAAAGVPIIGLEPSCILTLRDELPRLLPGDEEARIVARSAMLFEESLERWDRPALMALERSIVVHPHCHAKALARPGIVGEVLRSIPAAQVRVLDAGCCGMAGSFGYRRERHAMSVAMAEDRLLPAIRSAGDALIVAQGTSCRTQINDLAGYRAVHPAQVLAMQLPPR
jgi:FAD/FMN-containing dehydrogenase/Fe-S oxidoreductase